MISEITGGWNRVTTWNEQGQPLHSATFGPGTPAARNIRDLDLGDLDGDGKQEIVAGLWGGLVVVLDSHCQRRWTRRLPSPPDLLAVVGQNIVVGCEDGTVRVLDGHGDTQGETQVNGRLTCISKLGANSVLVATDRGELKRLSIQARGSH